MTTTVGKLTSGQLLARNALWNLVGMAAPILVAFFAMPVLINGMGKERFGLLAIIWMGVGYFSLFDMGLSRALTKMISDRLGREDTDDVGSLIWTTLAIMIVLALLGASLLFVFSQPLLTHILRVPEGLRNEGITAFRTLAAGLPIVVLTSALVALLEAHQRFATIAIIRIPLGVMTFAGPLMTLQFSPSLVWATAILLASRAIALVFYYLVASSVRNELCRPQRPERTQLSPLLSFGGWLTVTNVVGPLMTYLDRFFIGAILNLSAVTYYVTPYEVLSRFQMLPHAIAGVLFPAMAAAHSGGQNRFIELYATSANVIFWTMLPLTAMVFLLAPEGLLLWLGSDFMYAATSVVHWLAAGWMINTMARPAFTVLQSTGRPDLVAKAHLVELIPYLGLLWSLANTFGISGVAAAWTLRATADTIILNVIVARTLPKLRPIVLRCFRYLIATLGAFGLCWLVESLLWRFTILLLVVVIAALELRPIVRQVTRKFAGPRGG